MLSDHGCGVCAGGDMQRMAELVKSFVADQHFYDESSKRSIRYVCEYHEAKARCTELYDALSQWTRSAKKFAA